MNTIRKRSTIFLCGFFFVALCSHAQTYRNIAGWSGEINQRLESFLNGSLIIKERKVAVFDCDGTLIGQSPYYLADEAIYEYAKDTYAEKKDSLSRAKMAIVEHMLHGDNVGAGYIQNRVRFLSGLAPEEIENIGQRCFQDKYEAKFFPEMRELLANLNAFGFEVWVLTASPELLYQQFVHDNLGIPENRILGVKSVVSKGVVTDQLVLPVPQDDGKADAIQTFIKTRPLFVAGNSRGDLEMMNESAAIKLIVNPDNEKIQTGVHAGEMDGYTVKEYWDIHDGLTVYCEDTPAKVSYYVSEEWHIKPNKSNPRR